MAWWWVATACADDSLFDRGTAAAKAGDLVAATQAWQACVRDNDPRLVDCQWELGWIHWRNGDWAQVITAWEAVEKADPTRDKLARSLTEARGNKAGVEKMRAAAKLAPTTLKVPTATGQTIRFRAVGDIMLGTLYPSGYLPPDDGKHLLDGVAPSLRDADITFGNLEGPLCDEGTSDKCPKDATNCYAFHVPTRYGKYLKDAGFDMLSMANNHINDFGPSCRDTSAKTLDNLGITWSGTPGTIGTYTLPAGQTVGLVAFHTNPQTNHLNDLATSRELVSVAKKSHNFVVVSFHGGAEGKNATHVKDGPEIFLNEDRGDLKMWTHAMIDAGADIVLGHGPHVLRGMETYNGHLIVYSMGNFATYGRFNLNPPMGTTAIIEATIDENGHFTSGRILPVLQQDRGIPVPDPSNAGIDLVRQLSSEDFPKTSPIIAQDGTFAPRK